jgi:hypothetical protein
VTAIRFDSMKTPPLRVFRFLMWLLAVAAARAEEDPLPPDPETAQNAPQDWSAWSGVQRLLGESYTEFTSNYAYSAEGGFEKNSARRWAKVRFELEVIPITLRPLSGVVGWRVTRAEAVASSESFFDKYSKFVNSHTTVRSNGGYSGPLSLRTDPSIHIDRKTGKWAFMTLSEPAQPWTITSQGRIVSWSPVSPRNETHTDQLEGKNLEQAYIRGVAPKQIAPFVGQTTQDLSRDGNPESTRFGGRTEAFRVARVQFWPDWNDIEVVVEIEALAGGKDFARWRPRGNLHTVDRPGPQPLQIKATLRSKKQNPTSAQSAALPGVRRFRFELGDTSREPGVCMNWPVFGPDASAVPKEDPEYDLRFSDMRGFRTQLSPKKQKAGVKPMIDPQGRPYALAQIECYDFGAHADLRVIAELDDGREVTGFIEASDGPRYTIKLPERRDGSLIAQNWRDEMKTTAKDAADDDEQPTADGQKGDGFSTYEEYRGFCLDGAHKRLRPERKDLFVVNNLGTRGELALDFFMQKTADSGGPGFKVHYRLQTSEKPTSRAMNLNRTSGAPRTAKEPQHALIFQPRASGSLSQADFDGKENSVAWRPKNVLAIYVLSALDDLDFKSTIMHELSHSIGVRHHGQTDPGKVVWKRVRVITVAAGGPSTSHYFRETPMKYDSGTSSWVIDTQAAGATVRFFRENDQEIDPNSEAAETLFGGTTIMPWVAARGGQHSGVDSCYMRYDCAAAHIRPGRRNDRFLTYAYGAADAVDDELPGLNLCDDRKGTAFNDAAYNNNHPRYGDATQGNCRVQMCVRDDAPDKLAKP